MKKGFTLVELLVVMAVLSIFGILILTIFTNSLRGGNKSQIIGVIKQNGQAVLETMDKTVRNSDNVVCPMPAATDTLIVVKNGIYIRYRFIDPAPPANGFIQQDNPVKEIDPVTGEEYADPAFINKVCAPVDPMLNPVILTDTNSQTGISVANGLFTRDRSAGFMDQVTIKFDIGPGVGAPQAVAGQIDPVTFQTTISLR